VSPAQSRSVGQQVSPQQWEPVGQQVPPQQTAVAAQQTSLQHLPADGSQQVSPQVNDRLQQLSPAHPFAGGWHAVSPQWVTGVEQTALKQLVEQQSLSCVHSCPLALARQGVHWPLWALQVWPVGQVPHEPPQPFGPHCLPWHCGAQHNPMPLVELH
jgi:hypothetical protein